MKPVHQPLILAACLALSGLSATAQTPQPAVVVPGAPAAAATAPGPAGVMQQERRARIQQRIAQRQAALKQILQLTPAQEDAWNAWLAARRPVAMQRPNRAEFAQLPTPERIDRMRALRAARNAEQDRRGEATKVFYAALTPSQQKAFDALTARRGGRGMGGHRGGWRHHG